MIIALTFLTFFLSSIANANVGIPIVSIGLPFMLANFIFVVLIEVFVIGKIHGNLKLVPTIKQVFIANFITTVIGYPVVAIFEAMSMLFGLQLGWLLPFQNLSEMNLYVSTIMFFTLVPCYFLSVWLEGLYLRRYLSNDISWKSIYLANLASYLFLIIQVFTQFPIHLMAYGKYTFEISYRIVAGLLMLFMNNIGP